MQEASVSLSGQTQNAKRKMELSHTHHEMSERKTQYGNLTNDQLYICCFFFLMIFFLSFCCLHNENPCIGWEIQKKYNSGKWCSRVVEKIATQIARLHICVFFSTYLFSSCMVPPVPPLTPPAAQCCPGVQTVTTATCLCVARLCRFIRSALSLFSFPSGQSWWHHPMVWHICTKWLVFVYLSKYQGVLLWEEW